MERSRRQGLAGIAAVLGALLVRPSALVRLVLGRPRPAASGRGAGRDTPAARARRVRPSPFSVQRHG